MIKKLRPPPPRCVVCKLEYTSPSCGVYGTGGNKTCSVWCENINRRFFGRR